MPNWVFLHPTQSLCVLLGFESGYRFRHRKIRTMEGEK